MPARASPAAHRPFSCTVQLVSLAIRDGELCVLVMSSREHRAGLPSAAWNGARDLDDAARALANDAGTSAALEQVGTIGESAQLTVVYVGASQGDAGPPGEWRRVSALRALSAADRRAVARATEHVRDRVAYSAIAFRFVAPTFTLGELQHVYEVLLERSLHKASFRRALETAGLVAPTSTQRLEGRGRPARLFRFTRAKRRGSTEVLRFDF